MLDANAVARIAAEALFAYGGLDGGEEDDGGYTVEEPVTGDFSRVVRNVAKRLRDEGVDAIDPNLVSEMWPRAPHYAAKYIYIPPKGG